MNHVIDYLIDYKGDLMKLQNAENRMILQSGIKGKNFTAAGVVTNTSDKMVCKVPFFVLIIREAFP